MSESDSSSDYIDPLPKLNLNASKVIKKCKKGRNGRRLLQQQIDALKDVKKHFKKQTPVHVVLVSMPTGSGKTGVIACLPYYLGTIKSPEPESDELRYHFDRPILVIAPSVSIRDQLEQELTVKHIESRPPFLIKRKIVPKKQQKRVLPVAKIIEETSELKNQELLRSFEIVIANAQKFIAADWDHLDDNLFRLVIVDEAHHHPATTWQRIVDKFRSPDCPVFFFTATPYRSDKQPVLPQKSCTVYHLSLNTAVQRQIIRKTHFEELRDVHPDESFLNDIDLENLNPEAIDNMKKIIPILRKVKELLDKKRDETRSIDSNIPHMAIAIAKNRYYADRLLELWNIFCPNEPAETCYSKKKPNEKDEIMRKLKSNELSLVIIVGMLLEGFDHPPISIAAITCNIKSPVKFVQFIGRAQRIYRKVGYTDNVTADIVTHEGYQQAQNYDNFINEAFIPDTETVDSDSDEN